MKFNNNSLKFFYNKKDWMVFFTVLMSIFVINLLFIFLKFQDFKKEELYQSTAEIINIYTKQDYNILKLQDDNITFFTSISKKDKFYKLDSVNITIVTNSINFISYVKGFYAQSINIFVIENEELNIRKELHSNIYKQHENQKISELFDALFFAIPLSKEMRELCALFGVSHLVAISGFHLGVMSIVLFWILYYPYNFIHTRYFPYRNKKYDILIVTMLILFSYLIFTNIVPSLLRAFVMYIFGIYILRRNIKLLSYETLLIITLLIITFFPKFIFSLSLWFSIIAVFYIFLFLQYFKNIPKVGQFLLFNIWIYLVMNPISHYFFGTTSIVQLISPLFTIGFTFFYPIEALAHVFGFGGILDVIIEYWLNIKTTSYDIFTPNWFLLLYVILSFLSIFFRNIFIILNISFIVFNIYLYTQ